MKNKLYTFRLSEQLAQAVKQQAEKEGRKVSEIFRQGLISYLASVNPIPKGTVSIFGKTENE